MHTWFGHVISTRQIVRTVDHRLALRRGVHWRADQKRDHSMDGRAPHAFRTGAWGRVAGKRPAFADFEPDSFLRLYQTAHSESIVDKWDNFALGPRWSAA
jgi:hypothetical protein